MTKMRSAALILTLALAGCGIGRVPAPPTVFDLGLDASPVPALPAREPIALVFQAVPSLSDTSVIWRVGDSSPRILIRSGDTLSAISVRYHVPQAEILRANNFKTAADLKFGRSIIIPTAVKVELKAKTLPAEVAVDLKGKKKHPLPGKEQEQDKAILLATAVWIAIKDAIGAAIDYREPVGLDIPATPERVLLAIERLRGGGSGCAGRA